MTIGRHATTAAAGARRGAIAAAAAAGAAAVPLDGRGVGAGRNDRPVTA